MHQTYECMLIQGFRHCFHFIGSKSHLSSIVRPRKKKEDGVSVPKKRGRKPKAAAPTVEDDDITDSSETEVYYRLIDHSLYFVYKGTTRFLENCNLLCKAYRSEMWFVRLWLLLVNVKSIVLVCILWV